MISLGIQTWAGRIASVVIVPAYFLVLRLLGYRIRDLDHLRRQWRTICEGHRGPWLLCANHLTMIDSLILIYGLLSLGDHFRHYEKVPWNLPERDNFQRNPVLAVLCYLAKCLPVNRGGDREEMKKTLATCHDLLANGQQILVFPEGGRSRTGRIDVESYAYGVGRFVAEHPDCRVLCVYLRGDRQDTYSDLPVRGDVFTMAIEPFVPERVSGQGLRAQRAYAGQIVQRLARMEERYFACHRQRHCRSEVVREPGEERGSSFSRPGLHA